MTYPDELSASAQLFERASLVLPGGNSRLTVMMDPYPIYAASGQGPWVTDADGVRRMDFGNNYTSLIHGHAHPAVVAAVSEQVRDGSCFGLPTRSEILLAELLCDRLSGAERVRFTNSGTEAVMLAIKAARAHTGRSMVAKVEGAYHGAYDLVEVSLDPEPGDWGGQPPNRVPYAAGTPQSVLDEVVVLPFNDREAAERVLTSYGDRIAAVIVDPMPRRIGLIPANLDYLVALREITRRLGIVLIADEVITFRLGYRGALASTGIVPDLTALGKIIGGGFPVGAVAGHASLMSVFDARRSRPKVPHNGTFNANPITMVAGLAAMRAWTNDAVRQLNEQGERLRIQLGSALAPLGQVTGGGSLFRFHMKSSPVSDYRTAHPTEDEARRLRSLQHALVNAGYLLSKDGGGSLSTAMEDQQLNDFASAVASICDGQAATEARDA